MSVTRWGKVGILWLLAAGCAESTPTCGDLIEDRTLGRCVCPEGTTPTDDGWGCLLPDGGAIRNPNAPDAAVGPDAGSEDACVGCVCTEGATRECATGAMGVCSPGAQRCMEGAWSPCVSLQEATPETCNGLDDDCNGAPDDGTATTSCGATDRVRSAGCSGGACFVADCAPGFLVRIPRIVIASIAPS